MSKETELDELLKAGDHLQNIAEQRAIAERVIALATALRLPAKVALGHHRFGVLSALHGEYDIAIQSLTQAVTYSQEAGLIEQGLLSKVNLSTALFEVGKLTESYQIQVEMLQSASAAEYPRVRVQALVGAANNVVFWGDSEQGVQFLTEAKAIAETHGYQQAFGPIVTGLAECALIQKGYRMAKSILSEALQIKSIHAHWRCKLCTALARTLLQLGEIDEAEEYATLAAQESRDAGVAEWAINALVVLGDIDAKRERSETAAARYLEALRLAKEVKIWYLIINSTLALGRLYSFSSPERALSFLDESLNAAIEYGRRPGIEDIFEEQAKIYESQGKFALSLQALRKYIAASNELRDEKLRLRMQALEIERGVEEEKRKSALAQQQVILLQTELSYRAQALASQTDILSRFREELRRITRESQEPVQALIKIKEKLKELPCESVDWVKFEKEFAAVHPEFRKKLKEVYRDLSNQELRLCQLLRSGLKSHEAARLMCITERGVETHRLRIRKKLGLTGKDNLIEVLQAV